MLPGSSSSSRKAQNLETWYSISSFSLRGGHPQSGLSRYCFVIRSTERPILSYPSSQLHNKQSITNTSQIGHLFGSHQPEFQEQVSFHEGKSEDPIICSIPMWDGRLPTYFTSSTHSHIPHPERLHLWNLKLRNPLSSQQLCTFISAIPLFPTDTPASISKTRPSCIPFHSPSPSTLLSVHFSHSAWASWQKLSTTVSLAAQALHIIPFWLRRQFTALQESKHDFLSTWPRLPLCWRKKKKIIALITGQVYDFWVQWGLRCFLRQSLLIGSNFHAPKYFSLNPD